MNKILVASRNWSEIDLHELFSNYKFLVVLLSTFVPDVSLYYAKDKSVIATQLREFQPDNTAIKGGEETNSWKVLIIDAMTIVNKTYIRAKSIEDTLHLTFPKESIGMHPNLTK